MDDGGEGISWMGNIVKKVENLFSEVDGVVQQELTSVTNQLQTVGSSVMQFCMDIVKDECLQSSENTQKEPASDINFIDSNASKIISSKTFKKKSCEKEYCNENHLLCSSSVEPTDGVQFEASIEKDIDTRVHKKLEVIGKENLVKDKQSQPEMSPVVSLEEDKQHEMSDVTSPKKEESNNIEVASYYISSSMSSSYSDYPYESILDAEVTPAVASTESPDDAIAQGISDNDVTKTEIDTIESFHKAKLDDNCLEEEDNPKHIKTMLEIFASARRQESHISFLRREKPHYSMMKTIMQKLDQIVQEEEKLREQKNRQSLNTQELESCDSDWVIV